MYCSNDLECDICVKNSLKHLMLFSWVIYISSFHQNSLRVVQLLRNHHLGSLPHRKDGVHPRPREWGFPLQEPTSIEAMTFQSRNGALASDLFPAIEAMQLGNGRHVESNQRMFYPKGTKWQDTLFEIASAIGFQYPTAHFHVEILDHCRVIVDISARVMFSWRQARE